MRWPAISAGLLLALACASGGTSAGDEFPLKAKLRPHKLKMRLVRGYALPQKRKAAASIAAYRTKILKLPVLLADVDGDGRIDEPGVDGWCLMGATHLVPVESQFVLGRSLVRIRANMEKMRLAYSVTPIEGAEAVLLCLERLNARRLQNGLLPAGLDAVSSEACRSHAIYCDTNGLTHEEDPAKPGYTREGAAAGNRCSISGGGISVIPSMYSQFFHRFTLADPDTRAFGIGQGLHYACVDGYQLRKPRPWKWPVAIPAEGSRDQPLRFNRYERPLAYPEGTEPGFPITLQFRQGGVFANVKASLRPADKPKEPVELIVKWPGNPASQRFSANYNAILVVPIVPLRPSTKYAVQVSWTLDGRAMERAWTFTTVKR